MVYDDFDYFNNILQILGKFNFERLGLELKLKINKIKMVKNKIIYFSHKTNFWD